MPDAVAAVESRWNFGDLFDALAPALGERPALMHGDVVRTWTEFGARSNRLARALIHRGLQPNDKVAFVLRNSPAYMELFAACVKARLVHVNVNYRYVDNELLYVLQNSDARAVVFDAEFAPQIQRLRDRLDPAIALIQVDSEPSASVESAMLSESYEHLCSEGDATPLDIRRSGEDMYFQYTGGTTGMPKAVMWRQHDRISLFAMARGRDASDHAAQTASRSAYAVLLPACPLMHSTALTTAISTLCGGGAVVTLPGHRFDAAELLETIERRNVSALSIVGDAFARPVLDELRTTSRSFDLGSVISISSAGVIWSAECKQEMLNYFPNAILRDSLGSSEGSGLASMETRAGSTAETGTFVLGDGVKVFTEDFREVVPGSGELGRIAKSGYIPVGYYRDEVRTAETFPVVNGVRYAIPGDWCSVESDGTIHLIGRGSTCVNTGGEKVFPEEVEIALCQLPGVVDALVTGVPDERWGQAVAAVVRVAPGVSADAADMRTRLRERLAGYKIPKHLVFVDDVPRAASGKADYKRVQDLALAAISGH
jgi:3-oxocholest-4-en-26-oate---CoA ligase